MKRFVLAQNPLKGFPLDKVYRVPLKKEVLMQLYPTHDTYVKKVQESVEALEREIDTPGGWAEDHKGGRTGISTIRSPAARLTPKDWVNS